jgi:hypothetical protein
MRYSIEYIVAIARVFDEINLSDIEEAQNGLLLFSMGSKDYKMPKKSNKTCSATDLIIIANTQINRVLAILFWDSLESKSKFRK